MKSLWSIFSTAPSTESRVFRRTAPALFPHVVTEFQNFFVYSIQGAQLGDLRFGIAHALDRTW